VVECLGRGCLLASSRAARRRLEIQRNRLVTFTLGAAIAVLSKVLGALHITWANILFIWVVTSLSSVALGAVYYFDPPWSRRIKFSWVWSIVDLSFSCWVIYVSGGIESPWYIWYLSNILTAAFIGGTSQAVVLWLLAGVSYAGVLLGLGQLDDQYPTLLMRMLLMFAPFFYGLRSIAHLKRQREYVRHLKEEESRKVAELTRLSQALDERTQALAEANVKIREADRLKSQFLANMSHELRTPLNSIIGFSEILHSRLDGQLQPKHSKFLDNIHTSGTHLLGLINDILDLSKVEAGKLELHVEAFAVLPVVEGVINIMSGQARERGIDFHVEAEEPLPQLEADPIRFKQILYNLLSNAVKFSPDKSLILVTIKHNRARHSSLKVDTVEIAVRDQGPGIDPKDHAAVWEEFRQLDGTSTREHQGTGLGLAPRQHPAAVRRRRRGDHAALAAHDDGAGSPPARAHRRGRLAGLRQDGHRPGARRLSLPARPHRRGGADAGAGPQAGGADARSGAAGHRRLGGAAPAQARSQHPRPAGDHRVHR
jgi:signal transduction histidine kinase